MSPRSLAALVVLASAGPSATMSLCGKVVGAPRKHAVYVGLWKADGFLERPVDQVRLEASAPGTFCFHVAPGRWALSAFEDLNGNGVLDMGAFGPREPSGFWRPFHAWRKPRFDDVASWVDGDLGNADVALN